VHLQGKTLLLFWSFIWKLDSRVQSTLILTIFLGGLSQLTSAAPENSYKKYSLRKFKKLLSKYLTKTVAKTRKITINSFIFPIPIKAKHRLNQIKLISDL
jgi:hypothetical protein